MFNTHATCKLTTFMEKGTQNGGMMEHAHNNYMVALGVAITSPAHGVGL